MFIRNPKEKYNQKTWCIYFDNFALTLSLIKAMLLQLLI